ncbi:MAG: cytochrome c-type biogenesis protein CcmH [Alphaproteobacteria bacterium]|nr:cytochrome c-type biogenesis protein [Alphaproteobacteria bacterium]TAD87422.1 MAG: cytochrome c-type biogenesis protein CcmH [Alphaproteobacteria bacterium]
MRHLLLVLSLLLGLAQPVAAAFGPNEMLPDPRQEARAQDLSRQIRCVVCQNESIHDSPAEIARDLRRIVRERITAGDSDQQILDFVVARYGDFALLRPPVAGHTLILWFGPAVVLVLGGLGAWIALQRRSQRTSPAELSASDRARVEALLKDQP